MASHGTEPRPHTPPPSLWPVGFAVGIAVLLTGLIVSWFIVILGAVLAVSFGFLWIRDITTEERVTIPEIEPERREPTPEGAAPRADEGGPALPRMTEEEEATYPRSKFLEGATLGIGALIGGLVTIPAIGMMTAPPFVDEVGHDDVDIGGLDSFPEGEWRVVTFLSNPEQGEVSRRTAFVRYNGLLNGEPSFTIISNRCAHLGCPTQPGGLIDQEGAEEEEIDENVVTRIPANPANFSCPCHGGAYDTEGNRTAGPPVRALDRYEYAIVNGRLVLRSTYSVSTVEGTGKDATVTRYRLAYPGTHVDGPERLLYPVQPPR
jgi:Rieske Fe-S protein